MGDVMSELIVDRPNSEILVSPVKNYMNGEKYTLFIKDIKSRNGKVQNENVYMEFTIRY